MAVIESRQVGRLCHPLLSAALLIRQARRLRQLDRTLSSLDLSSSGSERVSHVVIPCHQESDVAAKTASFFRRHHPDVVVHFLSSREDRTSTAAALRAVGAEVTVFEARDPSKAALVNEYAKTACSAFAVYDADSAPTAMPAIPSSENQVVQQLSVYHALPGSTAFWRGVALNQTRWSLAHEAHALRQTSGWYLVGHGLAVRAGLLRREPFRTGIHGEDLELGYRLSYSGVKVWIDPSGVDCAGIPVSKAEFVEQAARWFIGDSTAVVLATRGCGLRPRLVLRVCGLCFWLVGPVIVIALCVSWTFSRDRVALLTLLASSLCEAASFAKLNGWLRRNDLPCATSWTALVGFLAKPGLSSLGALKAVVVYRFGTADAGPPKSRQRQREPAR
jgi:hypothetical protein